MQVRVSVLLGALALTRSHGLHRIGAQVVCASWPECLLSYAPSLRLALCCSVRGLRGTSCFRVVVVVVVVIVSVSVLVPALAPPPAAARRPAAAAAPR